MVAIDGTTPLNAASVIHKTSDDSHTGLFTNNGNVTISGGALTIASSAGIPTSLETRYSHGASFLVLPFILKYVAYPAALGTYYYPTAFYHSIPFGGYTLTEPTYCAVTSDQATNCTLSAVIGNSGFSTATRCCMLIITVTTRNQAAASYNPVAQGYVTIGV